MRRSHFLLATVLAALALMPIAESLAQVQGQAPAAAAPAAGRGGRGGGPAKTWWVEKLDAGALLDKEMTRLDNFKSLNGHMQGTGMH